MREDLLAEVGRPLGGEQHAVLAEHGVGAGRFGQVVEQRRIELRRQFGTAGDPFHRVADRFPRQQRVPVPPEVPQHARVAQRAVPLAGRDGDAVTLDQRVEVVPAMPGKERARELDGA